MFNLGLVLAKVHRKADALGAYRNARRLYETMGLEYQVQDCNDQINNLGFWSWLGRLWRWVRGWFRGDMLN